MAQFSLKDGIQFSFSTYGKHFVLLLTASALVAGSYWFATVAPRFVAEKLGVHQVLDVDMVSIMQQPQDQTTDQSTMVLQKVQEVSTKISMHLQAAPKHLLALVLLVFVFVWGLYLTLVLGLMKLVLAINDKDSGSLDLLFSVSPRQVIRFIGASILFGLYALCGIIGMAVLTIPSGILLKGVLGDKVTLFLAVILWIVLAIAMLFWLIGYSFYGYCIVDKPTISAYESLRMSSDLSRGVRSSIVAAIAILSLFGAVIMVVVNKLIMLGCACTPEQQRAVAAVAVMIFSYPFSMPFFSYLYRSLTSSTSR